MLKYLRNARLGKISFRDILLWRILLLSIPVLLLGQYVTYRKARSTLLETARQNLTESAISEGSRIEEAIAAWQSNLLTATETSLLQSGSIQASEQYLNQLASRWQVQCLQLQKILTGAIAASTCGNQTIAPVKLSPPDKAAVQVVLPETASASEIDWQNQLDLILSAPVSDKQGNGHLQLVVESVLPLQVTDEPKSLTGYTVVIDRDGTILAHPDLERVGQNIASEKNGQTRKRLSSLVRNAIGGEQYFQHVSSFDDSGLELLVGYTAIDSPTDRTNGKWVILAVTSLDNALFGLQEILQNLINLILFLIAANLVATLILARDLARPMEKLGEYARNVEGQEGTASIPHNFNIKEFNQLALALNSMVSRLKAWAEELKTAWQEAKVANQLKKEFLASISHEFRTPLNAIIGSVRLVLDDCCDDREEEKQFLQQADAAAVRLLEIIDDILDLDKLEAGTLSVDMERVELLDVLKEAVDLQMVQIQQKGLQLNWDRAKEAIAVQADRAKLKHVFLNVLSNAIKFTKTGSITITTRIAAPSSSSEGETYVTVAILDTGIGVDKSNQSKLFQPFVMADGSRTREFGGAGLGLAISRNLMELMHGSITLSSEGKDQGSTVEIALPVIKTSLLPKPTSSPA